MSKKKAAAGNRYAAFCRFSLNASAAEAIGWHHM
jgi:hypothetical protein